MKNLKILKTEKIKHKNGFLVFFQKSKNVKFNFKRMFFVRANRGQIRGNHAHKNCIQLLNCPIGMVQVICEDRNRKKYIFKLDEPNKYLIIPNKIWSVQKYLKKNTILNVLCSEKFKENDYIRKYKDFLNI
jgi:dTDP-4-dehydrorhamnose 3,5-epimerase-like enzyme